jgi:type I restriction enzyme S subunit
VSAVAEASAERSLHSLPSEWTWARLGDICDAINGRAFKSSEWRESGLPIVRIQNLKDPDAEFNYFAGDLDDRHRVYHGDLLFAWSGTPGTSFGAHIWKGPEAALNQHIFNIKFDPDVLDPRYFCLALNQNVSRYVAQAQGGVGLAHITKSKFLDSYIPLAPKAKQLDLVAEIEKQFSILDEAVANLKRVITRLAGYRERALDDAFASEPNAALGELISEGPQNGLYLPKGAYGSGTPIVRIDDYQTDWIRPVAELRRVRAAESQVSTWALQPGDLLVNRVNSMSHLGKCVVIPNALGGALFESNMMRFRLVPGVLPRYVELYLGSKIGKRCLTADAKWAVNQASINQKDVQATEIPLPSLDRQAHIIGEVDRRLSIVREVAAKVDANLKRTAALRQAVLSRVFQATSETESAQ